MEKPDKNTKILIFIHSIEEIELKDSFVYLFCPINLKTIPVKKYSKLTILDLFE